jgi:small acid-soluble spore protein I (minor)
MSVDIRKSIKENFKNTSKKEIIESINDAIKDNEDITLPGLGVFFEILWKNSNKKEQDNITNKIMNCL